MVLKIKGDRDRGLDPLSSDIFNFNNVISTLYTQLFIKAERR